jgi:hypothetical protein
MGLIKISSCVNIGTLGHISMTGKAQIALIGALRKATSMVFISKEISLPKGLLNLAH